MNSIKTIIDACSHFSVYLPKRVTDLFFCFVSGFSVFCFFCLFGFFLFQNYFIALAFNNPTG